MNRLTCGCARKRRWIFTSFFPTGTNRTCAPICGGIEIILPSLCGALGTEVGEQYTGTDGASVAKSLCDIVHEEDPTRPTTTAMNWAQATNALPATVDVI